MLVHGGFLYNFSYKSKNISWRCINRNWPGKIITDIEGEEILTAKTHCHESSSPKINKKIFINLIKGKSVNTNEPLECVVQDYAKETDISEIREVINVESIRDIFARHGRNILIPPQEFKNSDIHESLKITTDGKES